MSPTATAAAPPKFKRSARNYLLDSRFQLKYTGYLVGVTLVVALALGFLLYRQTTQTVEIGNDAVKAGVEANKAGKEAVAQSKALNEQNEIYAVDKYGDSPTLLDSMKAENDKKAAELNARANQFESIQANLESKSAAIQRQQKILMITLLAALFAFVAAIGLAGIVVTHKIVGPIFKMKRLLREVGDGKLAVQSRLRRGDEMHDLFQVFEASVERLRGRHQDKIKILDAAIEQATAANVEEATVAKIKSVRAAMQAELDVKQSTRPPPAK